MEGTQEAIVTTEAEAPVVEQTDAPVQEGDLLAGKFKTPDDLVKAYKALESKLGQQSQQPAPEEPAVEETPDEAAEEPAAEIDPEEAYGPYGKAVGEALKAAEVDPKAAATEFDETGTLSEETFGKFEQAGFPREMVEAYLRGISSSQEAAAEITEAQVAEVQALAGGAEGYAELADWIRTLPADVQQAYDASMTDVASAKAAVAEMVAARAEAVGVEGEVLTGKGANLNTGYATEAEWLADIAKPQYKTDAAYRASVSAKLAKSPHIMVVR